MRSLLADMHSVHGSDRNNENNEIWCAYICVASKGGEWEECGVASVHCQKGQAVTGTAEVRVQAAVAAWKRAIFVCPH